MDAKALHRVLLERLETIGIQSNHIPTFIKDIFNSFFINPHATFLQVNERLQFLGWNDVELDYHTFMLAKESFQG